VLIPGAIKTKKSQCAESQRKDVFKTTHSLVNTEKMLVKYYLTQLVQTVIGILQVCDMYLLCLCLIPA